MGDDMGGVQAMRIEPSPKDQCPEAPERSLVPSSQVKAAAMNQAMGSRRLPSGEGHVSDVYKRPLHDIFVTAARRD